MVSIPRRVQRAGLHLKLHRLPIPRAWNTIRTEEIAGHQKDLRPCTKWHFVCCRKNALLCTGELPNGKCWSSLPLICKIQLTDTGHCCSWATSQVHPWGSRFPPIHQGSAQGLNLPKSESKAGQWKRGERASWYCQRCFHGDARSKAMKWRDWAALGPRRCSLKKSRQIPRGLYLSTKL